MFKMQKNFQHPLHAKYNFTNSLLGSNRNKITLFSIGKSAMIITLISVFL